MNLLNFRWLHVHKKCCEILLIFLSCGEQWVGTMEVQDVYCGKNSLCEKETLHQALKLKGISCCSAIPDKKEVSLI